MLNVVILVCRQRLVSVIVPLPDVQVRSARQSCNLRVGIYAVLGWLGVSQLSLKCRGASIPTYDVEHE